MTHNVTKDCLKYGKKISHFLDNPRIIALISEQGYVVKTIRGCNGGTWLDERLLPEFYTWLSRETRLQVMRGEKPWV